MIAPPLVYIAGPYSSNPTHNTRQAILCADELYHGCQVVPIVPHLSMLWDLVAPSPLAFWYEYDMHVLRRCDAVFRIKGDSRGADAEVIEAERLGLPIFFDADDLLDWAISWRNP